MRAAEVDQSPADRPVATPNSPSRGPAAATTVEQLACRAVGYAGHQVHVVRRREAGWLLDALGDVRGRTVVDIAGGDGYWATQVAKRGASALTLDLSLDKLCRGQRLPDHPPLVQGDALHLPFPDATVDGVLSICALEHFPDAAAALAETARILRPGGRLALSADQLSGASRWPGLAAGHRQRYAVNDTFDLPKLTGLLEAAGFGVQRTEHMFKQTWAQGVYLRLHRWRLAPNALAPLGPIVALSDARTPGTEGAVILVQARRGRPR